MPQLGGKRVLVDQRAPGDIAGIRGLEAGEELAAHRGAQAVGADQELAAGLRAVGEAGNNLACTLVQFFERLSEVVARRGKAALQRPVDIGPAAHDVPPRRAVHGVAFAVEADALADLCAESFLHCDAELAEDIKQLVVGANARAARGEIVGHALVHVHIPTQVVQQVGRKEPAERTADDECA